MRKYSKRKEVKENPHHKMKKEEKKMSEGESMSDYQSQMKERGREIQEARKREKEAGAHMMQTDQGGPEAEERSKETGMGEHTMQTEAPTTSRASKEGFGMAGSKGTETIKRSKEQK